MKASLLLIIGAALVAGAAWYWAGAKTEKGEPLATMEEPALPPPTTTNTDATEVFQRAFWKRPTEKDRILHAERREWADGDGVDRWQWFIAVDPSAELARYLNEQNPFSMSKPKGEPALPVDQVPDWFPKSADTFDVQQSLDGQMVFLVHQESGRLFATSHGRGFAKAVQVPTPIPSAQSSSPPGRLPTTPPPTPPKS